MSDGTMNGEAVVVNERKELAISFGEALRRARIAAGLTQYELAEKLMRSTGTIRRWEEGGNDKPPSRHRIIRIEDALGVKTGALLKAAGHLDDPAPAKRSKPETDLSVIVRKLDHQSQMIEGLTKEIVALRQEVGKTRVATRTFPWSRVEA